MTKKLYEDDVYLQQADTVVTQVRPDTEPNRLQIQLRDTLFYPEGGGQPPDFGEIRLPDPPDGLSELVMQVQDVQYEGPEDRREIWHTVQIAGLPTLTDKPWSDHVSQLVQHLENQAVRLSLDWPRRFDHMQQHLGQHLLSASLYTLYEARTVGFHMGADYVTIDINQKLSEAQVRLAEKKANLAIMANLPVVIRFPDEATLAQMSLRKLPKVAHNIRIVCIEDYDYTPCGGTHPDSTGQVGMMLIHKITPYKGGLRLTFLSGQAALNVVQTRYTLLDQLGTLLSATDDLILSRTEKLLAEQETLNKRLAEQTMLLVKQEAAAWTSSPQPTLEFLASLGIEPPVAPSALTIFAGQRHEDARAFKFFMEAVAQAQPDAVRLFVRQFDTGFTVVLEIPVSAGNAAGASGLSLPGAKGCLASAMTTYAGKGGGSNQSAQATFAPDVSLRAVLSDILTSLNRG